MVFHTTSTFEQIKYPISVSLLIRWVIIRSLKFGESEWSSGVPSTLNWFEGISLDNDSNNQLVVFTDVSFYILVH